MSQVSGQLDLSGINIQTFTLTRLKKKLLLMKNKPIIIINGEPNSIFLEIFLGPDNAQV